MAFHQQYSADLLSDLYGTGYLNDGTIAILEGRFTRYDIPPTPYEWDASSTATDDGVNVLQPTGNITGRWLLKADYQLQSDWNETNTNSFSYIQNKPMLAPVAMTGNYTSLTGKPTIPTTSDQLTEGSTNLFFTTGRVDAEFATRTTDALAEGSVNLYYTPARFDARLGTKTTDNLTEGTTNQYYTSARFSSAFAAKNTDALSEGTMNRYFTNARAQGAISLTTTGSGAASYNSGVLNIPTPVSPTAPTFNANVTRLLSNSSGSTNQFTISSTQNAMVFYTITLSCVTPLLAGSSVVTVFLEYSTNGGTTWITGPNISNSQTVSLAVSIQITTPQNYVLSGAVPANALVRLRTTSSGTTPGTATFVNGFELLT